MPVGEGNPARDRFSLPEQHHQLVGSGAVTTDYLADGEPDWYLSIEDKRDSLEYSADDLLDLSGWELRKAFRIFRKSNPPLLEWFRSPVTDLEQFSTAERIRYADLCIADAEENKTGRFQ